MPKLILNATLRIWIVPGLLLLAGTHNISSAQTGFECGEGLLPAGASSIAFQDTVKALVVFVRFQDDTADRQYWPAIPVTQLPPIANDYIKETASEVQASSLTLARLLGVSYL